MLPAYDPDTFKGVTQSLSHGHENADCWAACVATVLGLGRFAETTAELYDRQLLPAVPPASYSGLAEPSRHFLGRWNGWLASAWGLELRYWDIAELVERGRPGRFWIAQHLWDEREQGHAMVWHGDEFVWDPMPGRGRVATPSDRIFDGFELVAVTPLTGAQPRRPGYLVPIDGA